MKLKFKQSIFIVGIGNVDADREIEFKNKAQAKSLIEAGFAEEVIEEKPKVKTKSKKTTAKDKKVEEVVEEDGE